MYIKSESYLCKIFRFHFLFISCQNPRHFSLPRFSLWLFSWICSISVSFLTPLTKTFSVFSILLVCFWTKPKRRKEVKCLISRIWRNKYYTDVTWKVELVLCSVRIIHWLIHSGRGISLSNVLLRFVSRNPNCTLAPLAPSPSFS